MDLNKLIGMSRKYGADPDYVLAGGGNTSYKEADLMAVKASGAALSEIDEDGFVMMDLEKLRVLTQADYPEDDNARETLALKGMMAARLEGQGEKRPSVECILHALFDRNYVLHVHPSLINGLTCGQNGMAAAIELFEDIRESFIWAPLIKPGFTLSKECAGLFLDHKKAYGRYPSILLLQNHGLFIAADTVSDNNLIMNDVVSRITKQIGRRPDSGLSGLPPSGADEGAKALEALCGGFVKHLYNNEIARFTVSREAYEPIMRPFTPDHIVYCRAYPVYVDSVKQLPEALAKYTAAYGGNPKIIAIRGLGVFALGKNNAEAGLAAELFIDTIKVAVFSESFGGPLTLPDDFTDFIVNWESESYRQKKSIGQINK